MDWWDDLAQPYVCDLGPEMGMTTTSRDAAGFLLEFGFVEGGGGCPRIKQTKARLVGRT